MEATIVAAIIGAIAAVAAAFVTARTKDKNYASKGRQDTSSPMLSPSQYGIKIVTPADYEHVDTGFPVSGTYEHLPEEHHIWVFTFGVDTDSKGNKIMHYWPQEKANTDNGKWYSKVYNIGGRSGESKEFMVMVVGKEGQALIRYFKDAGSETQKWPPIKKLTSDIVVECALGKVRLR